MVYLVRCKAHEGSKEVEVFDVRGACCLETAGLGKKLGDLSSGDVLEVLMDRSMKEMAGKIVDREKCEVIEIVDEGEVTHLKIRKKVEGLEIAERKMGNCMVCGGTLEYVAKAVEVACDYCSKKKLPMFSAQRDITSVTNAMEKGLLISLKISPSPAAKKIH